MKKLISLFLFIGIVNADIEQSALINVAKSVLEENNFNLNTVDILSVKQLEENNTILKIVIQDKLSNDIENIFAISQETIIVGEMFKKSHLIKDKIENNYINDILNLNQNCFLISNNKNNVLLITANLKTLRKNMMFINNILKKYDINLCFIKNEEDAIIYKIMSNQQYSLKEFNEIINTSVIEPNKFSNYYDKTINKVTNILKIINEMKGLNFNEKFGDEIMIFSNNQKYSLSNFLTEKEINESK
ncbi:hypothetical protein [Campylobacter canadensis]|uniref:hypothetical protein n=1 Tax=Campylobacter canadensis TaxID=449520 RepID=UPI001CCFCA4B|nr:hypothetical protein [Campylobacter canadensis]MBZ8002387.1 hypothetical protein [Campylobacter canadensis]